MAFDVFIPEKPECYQKKQFLAGLKELISP